MTYFMAILLGLVQGITEFLPVSSSGHLALMQHFFSGMQEPDNLYTILLHFATLIAVCIVYWQDIVSMIVEFFRGLAALFTRRGGRETEPPAARRLVMLVILGTLPLVLVLPINDKLDALSSHPAFITCALMVTGFLLFFSDRMAKGRKTERTARVTDALLVGVAQCIATVPGLSRSGTTIAAGMALGFDRKFAVRYSFLLSLPAVLGATLLQLIKTVKAGGIDMSLLPKYLVGMVVAGVVGYFSIQLVKLLADKDKFGKFAYYCWAVGIVALIACIFVK